MTKHWLKNLLLLTKRFDYVHAYNYIHTKIEGSFFFCKYFVVLINNNDQTLVKRTFFSSLFVPVQA